MANAAQRYRRRFPTRLLRMGVSGAAGAPAHLRHRVEAARVPGVAGADARQAKPGSLEDAEARDGLQCVARAARIKTAARPKPWADRTLIDPDQQGREATHRSPTFFHRASRLARSAGRLAQPAAGRALTTRSTAGSSR